MALCFKHKDDHINLTLWKIEEPVQYFLERIILFPSEVELFLSLQSDRRKLEYAAARFLLRVMTGKREPLLYEESGRPVLNTGNQISISHCEGYIAVMLTEEGQPGMDVEMISPRAGRVKSKFLSIKELELAGNDDKLLTLLWSAKEALFKMCIRQGINFKTNLSIESENITDSGTLKTAIKKEDQEADIALSYKIFEDIVLVWGVNNNDI
ncbi:4'-phosphopantetheinyl transferase superfamily protein [Saccharicrinis sp. FJH62]|uniref:4'-phosphopantetheinyl transferase superfamily protein n=1 Tax=Saccharicrinis sp. FJH62 TaxID=3344657 RepID=UPI0035D3EF36